MRTCKGIKRASCGGWIPLSALLWVLPTVVRTQPLSLELVTELPPVLNEVSGLLRVGTDTWVILDSGNENALYRISEESGEVLQQVTLSNAINVDWEAIVSDGTNVYVADIGNNAGSRPDLRIYRFPLAALTSDATTIGVDSILYHYEDQSDFTPAPDNTRWDAEALVAMDDSLFLFTKDWIDGHTHVYALPALSGDHVALRRTTFDVQGLVTDAAFDAATGRLALLGHDESSTVPFIWVLSAFGGHGFFSGDKVRHPIEVGALQAEALAWTGPGEVYIGNEWALGQAPALWAMAVPMGPFPGPASERVGHTFPIPADRYVHVEGADPAGRSRIYELNGALLAETVVSGSGDIALPYLAPGEYVLELKVRSETHRVPLVISH
jgi:hypothetical protein